MEILSLHLFAVNGFQDVYRRSYKTNFTQETINALDEATRGGNNITQTAISQVASNFIAPSAEVEGHASIINGWGINRFRFIMEVMEFSSAGTAIKAFYIGYTDYADGAYITKGGGNISFDPNLQFYITNVNRLKVQQTPMGNRMVADNAHQLIFNQGIADVMNGQGLSYLMRPMEVFSSQNVLNAMNELGVLPSNTIDVTGSLAVSGNQSSRRNNVPGSYIFDTLKAYEAAHHSTREHGWSDDNFYSEAQAHLKDSDLFYDPLFRAMRDASVMNIHQRGQFSWKDLNVIAPHIDNITILTDPKEISLRKQHIAHTTGQAELGVMWNAMNTANWNAATREAVAATLLANAVPSIMLENLVADMRVSMTNMTNDGSVAHVFNTITPFAADNPSNLAMFNRVVDRIKMELIPTISVQNQVAFDLLLDVSVYGETMVTISINGGPRETYVMPTFADNGASPILTNDINRFNQVTNDMFKLGDTLFKNANNIVLNNTLSPSNTPVVSGLY